MKNLEEIAKIQSGIYAKPSPSGNVKYLQGKCFDEFGNLDEVVKPELKLDEKLKKHLLQKGDILFAGKGTRNYAVVYKAEWGKCIPSSTFMVFKLSEAAKELILPEYLTWFINHEATQNKITGMAKGSYIQSVPKSSLKNLEIEIPDIKMQNHIVQAHQLNSKAFQLSTKINTLKNQLTEQQLLNQIKKSKNGQ